MTKLTKNGQLAPVELTNEDLNILFQAGVIPKETPPAQVKIFARICAEKNLSPFSKEIHLVKYGNQFSVITGIDGFRKKAVRTSEYAGCDAPKFDLDSKGVWKTAAELKIAKKLPISATVTVYRIVGGMRVAFTAECLFDEYAGRRNGQLANKWASMPFNMIAKCAEGKAYKKAFADELSGLHIPEEAAAFEDRNTGPVVQDVTEDEKQDLIEQVKSTLSGMNRQQVIAYWNDNPSLQRYDYFRTLFDNRRKDLHEKGEWKYAS